MWHDITYAINDKMPPFPGQPEIKIDKLCSIKEGDTSNVTLLNFSAHTGTHMDAPLHFIEEGKDITQLPLEIAMGSGRVIHIKDDISIKVEEIRQSEELLGPIRQQELVFFKTKNSRTDWSTKEFIDDYIFLSKEAAQYLTDQNIGMVGIDYLSISAGDINPAVHQILLGNGCWIVEGLDLRNVEHGLFDVICLPIKIAGADGAPARVLIKAK